MDLADLEKHGMISMIEALQRMKWTEVCTVSEPSYPHLAKAFYTCLHSKEDGSLTSLVKGKPIRITHDLLERLFGVSKVYTNLSQWCRHSPHVDTSSSFQETCSHVWDSVSTLPGGLHKFVSVVSTQSTCVLTWSACVLTQSACVLTQSTVVSTHSMFRSTLVLSSRKHVLMFGPVCRHTPWWCRHSPAETQKREFFWTRGCLGIE
ncbi:hypothetical protein Taro_035762, partial [Colocasia esculenta]|nr:hypothetical protein [Colocasia esculenta]